MKIPKQAKILKLCSDDSRKTTEPFIRKGTLYATNGTALVAYPDFTTDPEAGGFIPEEIVVKAQKDQAEIELTKESATVGGLTLPRAQFDTLEAERVIPKESADASKLTIDVALLLKLANALQSGTTVKQVTLQLPEVNNQGKILGAIRVTVESGPQVGAIMPCS